jgi:hypothetical protein
MSLNVFFVFFRRMIAARIPYPVCLKKLLKRGESRDPRHIIPFPSPLFSLPASDEKFAPILFSPALKIVEA